MVIAWIDGASFIKINSGREDKVALIEKLSSS